MPNVELCLVAGLLFASAASAQDATARAAIESITISVFDLTPQDASDPAVEFVGFSSRAADAFAPGIGSGSAKYIPEGWTPASPPFRLDATTDVAFASVAGDPAVLSLSAFGRSPQVAGEIGAWARGTVFGDFRLSSHAQATFSGLLAIDGGAGSTPGAYSLATVYVAENSGALHRAELRQGSTTGVFSQTLPFSFTVQNDSDAPLTYGFGQEVTISAGVPAIPEPSAVALLLCGLAAGSATRLRRIEKGDAPRTDRRPRLVTATPVILEEAE